MPYQVRNISNAVVTFKIARYDGRTRQTIFTGMSMRPGEVLDLEDWTDTPSAARAVPEVRRYISRGILSDN